MKEITSTRLFKTSLFTFLTCLLFFGTMNVFAQSGEEIKIEPAWKETKWFHNEVSQADDKEEDNMNSRNGVESLNSAWTVFSLMAPELTPGEFSANDGIPYDLKRGILGMLDDAGTTAYASYPKISIGEHLAQEWVPGYKDTAMSVYAADSGYDELKGSGIVPLWTKALNISYVIFVLVMIVAGFLIMFRHKIGGQAMVTLGTVLSKVIVSLILATFSFAIAGFIIDIGGLLTSAIASIMDKGKVTSISNIIDIMATVLGKESGGIFGWNIVGGIIQNFNLTQLFTDAVSQTPLGITSLAVGTIALALAPMTLLGAGVIQILLMIIVLCIIFYGAFKVLWTLYKAYFTLLINVILGPIQITIGAIPGYSNAVKNWLYSIIRNVMVFPVIFFILNLPNVLADSGGSVILKFPEKLVYEDTTIAGGVDAGGILVAIMRVFVLFFAAQAPKFLESAFPAETNKANAEALLAAKGNLAKIPLIGSMFK